MARTLTRSTYPPPLDALLRIGPPGGTEGPWRLVPLADYAAMGIRTAHVPDLIRMAKDQALLDANPPESYGPAHACRGLAALRALESIPDLVHILRRACREGFDYWAEDMETVFSVMGAGAIVPLTRRLLDQREDFGARLHISGALERMATDDAAVRPQVIAAYLEVLRWAEYNDETVNGSVVASLVEMNAVEAMDAIRRAFHLGAVDDSCCGDLEKVEQEIALTPEQRQARLHERFAGIEVELKDLSPEELLDRLRIE